MSISNHLNKIKNAVFGKDVRRAIHDAIKQCYDDASINHDNANMEVKLARGTHDTLNDRLDKSDQNLAQTNAQLSQYVKRGYGTLNDFDEETRIIIQGMDSAEINAVLGDKNVLTENLADRSVTVDKCAFNPVVGKITNNLIQIDTMLEGYYIQHQNGSEAINIEYSVTDFIHALPNQKYTLSHRDQLAFYDGEKNYIGGIDNGGEEGIYQTFTFETPNNARYIRLTVRKSLKDVLQFEFGDIRTSYEKYRYYPSDIFLESMTEKFEQYKSIRSVFEKLAQSLVTNDEVVIKLIGDSITHGLKGTGFAQTGEIIYGDFKVNENGYCWANLFKAHMESKFNCEVLNFGTTGRNSTELLNNIHSIVREDDDIVICMIGTNNRHTTTKTTLYQDLINIYKEVKSMGKEIILMSNIPASLENENESVRNYHMEDVDHIISCAASTLNCEYISVYKLFIEYCQTRNITIDSLLADGLHPNDKGYDVMFYLISNALGFGTKRDGANWI